MAHAILIKGGGGVGGSDEVTVHQKDIPKGLTAITADSDDEIITGTLELTGNAEDANVLETKTYYNTDLYTKHTGTMKNYSGTQQDTDSVWADSSNIYMSIKNHGYYASDSDIKASKSSVATAGGLTAAKMLGGQSAFGISGTALNDATIDSNADMLSGVVAYGKNGTKYTGSIASQAGITFTPSNKVQYGNYKGKYMTGNITVNAVANLTAANILKGKTVGGVAGTATSDATALANKILNGYTAYVNGVKITGNVKITSAINFSATALSATSIRISWTNPSQGAWEGVEIRMSTSSSPGASGGTQKYKGRGTNGTVGGASNYVDLTDFSPGTTYYFTCTSYVTGLGNGSSYNVNVKTKGFLIYDRGKAVGTIEDGTIYDELTINSDNLHVASHHHDLSGYSQKRTMGAYNVLFNVDGIATLTNLDNYTNIVIETKPIAYAYRATVVANYSLAFKWKYFVDTDDEYGWEWTYWKVSGSGSSLSLGSIQTLKIPIPVSEKYGHDKEDYKNTYAKYGYPDIITVGGNYHCYVDQEYAWGEYYLYRVYLE